MRKGTTNRGDHRPPVQYRNSSEGQKDTSPQIGQNFTPKDQGETGRKAERIKNQSSDQAKERSTSEEKKKRLLRELNGKKTKTKPKNR